MLHAEDALEGVDLLLAQGGHQEVAAHRLPAGLGLLAGVELRAQVGQLGHPPQGARLELLDGLGVQEEPPFIGPEPAEGAEDLVADRAVLLAEERGLEDVQRPLVAEAVDGARQVPADLPFEVHVGQGALQVLESRGADGQKGLPGRRAHVGVAEQAEQGGQEAGVGEGGHGQGGLLADRLVGVGQQVLEPLGELGVAGVADGPGELQADLGVALHHRAAEPPLEIFAVAEVPREHADQGGGADGGGLVVEGPAEDLRRRFHRGDGAQGAGADVRVTLAHQAPGGGDEGGVAVPGEDLEGSERDRFRGVVEDQLGQEVDPVDVLEELDGDLDLLVAVAVEGGQEPLQGVQVELDHRVVQVDAAAEALAEEGQVGLLQTDQDADPRRQEDHHHRGHHDQVGAQVDRGQDAQRGDRLAAALPHAVDDALEAFAELPTQREVEDLGRRAVE